MSKWSMDNGELRRDGNSVDCKYKIDMVQRMGDDDVYYYKACGTNCPDFEIVDIDEDRVVPQGGLAVHVTEHILGTFAEISCGATVVHRRLEDG